MKKEKRAAARGAFSCRKIGSWEAAREGARWKKGRNIYHCPLKGTSPRGRSLSLEGKEGERKVALRFPEGGSTSYLGGIIIFGSRWKRSFRRGGRAEELFVWGETNIEKDGSRTFLSRKRGKTLDKH